MKAAQLVYVQRLVNIENELDDIVSDICANMDTDIEKLCHTLTSCFARLIVAVENLEPTA